MTPLKLKILVVTMDYCPPYGGIGTVTVDLVNELSKLGHTVKLLNFDGRSSNNFIKFRPVDLFGTIATINHFKINIILTPIKSLKHYFSLYRDFVFYNMVHRVTASNVQYYGPDLIHLTRTKLYSAVVGSNIPFVTNCHAEEVELSVPNQYISKFAKQIICYSNFTKRKFTILYPKCKTVKVVYPSIRLKDYFTLTSPARKNQVVILSRLELPKNVDTAIKAISLLPKQILSRYKFFIIGDGSEKSSLETLVKSYRLESVINFLGSISQIDKIRLLLESKLFLLVPRVIGNLEEAFGICYIEAQAAGLPTIGSNIGGIPEAIGNGGLYVENNSRPVDVTNKIVEILDNEDMYNRLCKNISQRINKFDSAIWIRNITNIYYNVLK